MSKSSLANLLGELTPNEKAYRWWALGVFLLGFFFLLVFEPPPDEIIFQCDRSAGICTIQESGFFRTKTINVKIEQIRYAHFDTAGFLFRGYHGPDIKLQDGNDISIGTSNSFFARSREQQTVKDINDFLTNTESKQILVTHKSFPTAVYAVIVLFGGLYSIYKGLRPYIIQGLNNNDQ